MVCVKQVVDSSVPLDIDTETNDICHGDVAWVANPADLAAIQIALSIRDHLGEGQVIALSAGPGRVDQVLRKCLALGADRGVRLDAQPENPPDPETVVSMLAAAARHLQCGLVLCGSQAQDTLSGQTGIALSAALEWPVISSVTQLVRVEDGHSLVLQSRLDGGRRQIAQVNLPAVLTCEPGASEPPYPPLPMLMRSQAEPIDVLSPADIGSSAPAFSQGGRIKAVAISPPRPRPKKIFTPDSALSAAERMKQVISGGLAQRQSDHLEGTTRETAAALVDQLRQRKVL